MKLGDILENVIDFQAARKKRDEKKNQVDVDFTSQETGYDPDIEGEVALLADWYANTKTSLKIPGFPSLEEVFNYLIAQLRMPIDTGHLKDWLRTLHGKDEAKVKMLIHYLPELTRVFNEIKAKIEPYKKYIGKSGQATEALQYILWEVENQEFVLQALSRIPNLQ